ncbi:MAG: CCA tRNA nucleotidyltransferase [Candidatus Spechtbacteria bacterium]|nr:CCA tRNA nucleotidyltransferase [Candidatus Spechtbacteria bacterium]
MTIPKQVKTVLDALEKAGFDAHIVGGCVRDLLQAREPKDWDITTNAKPEDVQKLFPDSFYENKFGTVGVKTGSKNPALDVIEITTYRVEEKYTDKRHPDAVRFTAKLEDDLARRDFTINALALTREGKITDIFDGVADLKNKLIRTVGEAKDRFNEDALRMMRAVRLATELGFEIEQKTFEAVKQNAHLINLIAKERVRDELIKIIDAKNAYDGILLLQRSGLLRLTIPELEAGVGVAQNKHHIYTVFEHNTLSLKWAAEHDYPFHVKVAALFHDIGKPQTKRGEGPDATFYGHEIVGAKITKHVLENLRFPSGITQLVCSLVKNHLFYYNIGEVTEKSIRRLVAKVGPEHMDDLVKVRICDRMGSGVPKPEPYRLRHFRYMVEKVQKDPISVKLLKVNGEDVMKILEIAPGPKVGQILAILLDEVLDEPKLNTKKYLKGKVKELGKMADSDLAELTKKAREKEQKFEKAVDEEVKEKYWIK